MLSQIISELHHARHQVMTFGQDDESPLLDAGVGVGFLLGLTYACTYQRAALRLNRAVFDDDRIGVRQAIDILGEAVAERVLGVAELSDGDLLKRWIELARKDEGEADTETEYWPLPTEEHGTQAD